MNEIQLRRGLTQAFDFATKLRLARQANEQQASERAARSQEQARGAAGDRRIKTALELARLGNVQAEGGLQSYVGGTDETKAFENIGAFDQQAATYRSLAERHLKTLLGAGQYDAANELGEKVGLPTRFAPTASERAGADLLGARKLSEEADRESQAAITTARVKHINALEKVARTKIDKIAKEIQQAAGGGKLALENVKSMREVLSASNDILQEQLQKIAESPDFYTDANRTQINPTYASALRELSKANKYNRDLLNVLTQFQAENALPTAQIPNNPLGQQPSTKPFGGLQGMFQRVAPENPAFQLPQFQTSDGLKWTIDPKTGNYIQVR